VRGEDGSGVVGGWEEDEPEDEVGRWGLPPDTGEPPASGRGLEVRRVITLRPPANPSKPLPFPREATRLPPQPPVSPL